MTIGNYRSEVEAAMRSCRQNLEEFKVKFKEFNPHFTTLKNFRQATSKFNTNNKPPRSPYSTPGLCWKATCLQALRWASSTQAPLPLSKTILPIQERNLHNPCLRVCDLSLIRSLGASAQSNRSPAATVTGVGKRATYRY